MAKFTAKDVNNLRKSTGAGMMDCKRALTEADGDVDKAVELLREKGLATQAKKAGRIAAEGMALAKVSPDGTVGCVVEVNSETDFVANTPEFQKFVNGVADTVLEKAPADLDALKALPMSGGTGTVEEALQELFLRIRENLQIRRFVRVEDKALAAYTHGGGSIAVLVYADTPLGATQQTAVALKDCAMQVCAMNPPYLSRETVPAEVKEEEMKIIRVQMADDPKMAKKPEKILEKIAVGKLEKFYKESCLLEQEFVKNDDIDVQTYVDGVAKAQDTTITLTGFVRYVRGEGIEKKADNFADEVAGMLKG